MSQALTIVLDPLFRASRVPLSQLAPRDFSSLMSGTLGALVVPELLSAGQSAAAVAALDALPGQTYDPGRVPHTMGRIGPALNDHRQGRHLDAGTYWPLVDQARTAWDGLGLAEDPSTIVLDRLAQAWGSPINPATIDGRPVWPFTIREINNGTYVHYDEILREYPHGVFDQEIVWQLTLNVWVSAPAAGGETSLWRRRWTPADQRFAQGYGYQPVVTFGHQRLDVAPDLGAGLLMSPSWYHMARLVVEGRRVALSCFLGYTLSGQLVTWS